MGIQKLPDHLVHQIAAGEVIERPASALKELIENSIDAGASNLEIEYEAGGLGLLRLMDDGQGIEEQELPLAFQAHATSKLQSMDDFDRLQSFGFRGEALCSMASVGDLEIWTSTPQSSLGSRGRQAFGGALELTKADKRRGTQITLRDLFVRHPARLKFIKSERAESLQLHQVFRRYALSHPEISWRIRDLSGKKDVQVSQSNFLDRVLWFFDEEDANRWLEMEHEGSSFKFKIFAIKPRYIGDGRGSVHLFLNRRPIKDAKLEFALRRGFESFTERPRDLSAVVYLEGDPKLFDVNVHPMKTEVRFVDADRLFSDLVHVVRSRLEGLHRESFMSLDRSPVESSPSTPKTSETLPLALAPARSPEVSPDREHIETRSEIRASLEIHAPLETQAPNETQSPNEVSPIRREAFVQEARTSEWEYLGNLDQTYLIVKRREALFIFDQHALHERILFERLMRNLQKNERLPSQRLLFPIPITMTHVEALLEKEELLERLGFELRLWNDGKVQMVSAPEILKRGYQEVLRSLSESFERPLESLSRDVLASLACHSAVRAHDRLSPEEIQRLLKDFSSEDALGHCPHGRPTYVEWSLKDLEKCFHRIQ